jgi:hypothetical protein
MTEDETLRQLRREADFAGIEGCTAMNADQLRAALHERHRGLDPKQAHQQATGEQH